MTVSHHTATEVATSPLTTSVTLFAGLLAMFTNAFNYLFGHREEVIFVLMSLVFLCQLAAFANRFRLWLFEKRDSDKVNSDDE